MLLIDIGSQEDRIYGNICLVARIRSQPRLSLKPVILINLGRYQFQHCPRLFPIIHTSYWGSLPIPLPSNYIHLCVKNSLLSTLSTHNHSLVIAAVDEFLRSCLPIPSCPLSGGTPTLRGSFEMSSPSRLNCAHTSCVHHQLSSLIFPLPVSTTWHQVFQIQPLGVPHYLGNSILPCLTIHEPIQAPLLLSPPLGKCCVHSWDGY